MTLTEIMMTEKQLNRAAAWNLVCEYTQGESLRLHMLAVETAVRAYAEKFQSQQEIAAEVINVDKWAIVGLLHDFDYERWPDPPDQSPKRGGDFARSWLPRRCHLCD